MLAENAPFLDPEIEAVEGRHRAAVEGPARELAEAAEDGLPLDETLGEDGGRRVHWLRRIRRTAVTAGRKSRST
jgi:hypothetical protein